MEALRVELEARLVRLQSWGARQARLGQVVKDCRKNDRAFVEADLLRNLCLYREEVEGLLPCLVEYLLRVGGKGRRPGQNVVWEQVRRRAELVAFWCKQCDWLGKSRDQTRWEGEAIVSRLAVNGLWELRRTTQRLSEALMIVWYRES